MRPAARDEALDAIEACGGGQDASGRLVAILSEGDHWQRVRAIELLARFGDSTCVAPLIEVLEDDAFDDA